MENNRKFQNFVAQIVRALKVRSLRSGERLKGVGAPLIAGYMTAPTGLGEGARLIYTGLKSAGVEARFVDLTSKFLPELGGSVPLPPSMTPEDPTGPLILHVNPPEMLAALEALGAKYLKNRKIIGVWAWEQERLPESWLKMQDYLDEVWAISRYMYEMLSDQLSIPVFYTGYPASLLSGPQTPSSWPEKQGDSFTVFMSFDPRSGDQRKNPAAGVKAFQDAFPDTDDLSHRLLIKITSGTFSIPVDWTQDPRISITQETLSDVELRRMIAQSDCIISLHRSEGYGLQIAKALSLGVPAIFTDFGAPSEFAACPASFPVSCQLSDINPDQQHYKKGLGKWAEADIDCAVSHLKTVRALSPSDRLELQKASINWWADQHSLERFLSRIPPSTKDLFSLESR